MSGRWRRKALWARRLGWLLLIWALSVTAVYVVALVIRLMMKAAHLGL